MTTATATPTTTDPTVQSATVANSRWSPGYLFSFLLTADETGGAFTLLEVTGKGAVPPRHIHHREDEIYYVLEGELTFEVGGRPFAAPAGSAVWLPRGIEHGFAIESDQAKVLLMLLPSGGEGYFAGAGRPAEALAIPTDPPAPYPLERLLALGDEFGIEVTGPPVEPRR